MHKYFLAYVWRVGPSTGYGNCVTETTEPMRSADILHLTQKIQDREERLPAGARVTIINIVSLDWP